MWCDGRLVLKEVEKKKSSLSASLLGVGMSMTTGLQWQNQPRVGVCGVVVTKKKGEDWEECSPAVWMEEEKKRQEDTKPCREGKPSSRTTCRATCLHRSYDDGLCVWTPHRPKTKRV